MGRDAPRAVDLPLALRRRAPRRDRHVADRASLPAPNPTGLAGRAEYVAPRNPLERQLRDIWSEVLSIERIGIHDDLFDLGADSLTITRVRNRLIAALSWELTIAMLFDKPSIAELANEIERAVGSTRNMP